MSSTTIQKSSIKFLKTLKNNNNREWFTDHKPTFESAKEDIKAFVEELEKKLNKHDHIAGYKLFRIYRDVRFSKDKTPYKTSFGIHFRRATARLRGGYYLHIEPGSTFVGGGFWKPEKEDLLRIRQEFERDDQPMRKIIKEKNFQKHFGSLQGDAVKTAPKGFSKDHPAIDLIRMKSFTVSESFTDKEVLQDDFIDQVHDSFMAMRPFFDYLSMVLTTDLNGVSIFEE